MKKFLIVLLAVFMLAYPVTVAAYSTANRPKSPNIIYEIDDESIRISVFDDQDNKCYVAYENRVMDAMPSISCVKR